HWGYEGEDGPDKWFELSAAYKLCREGKHQSPVNIEKGTVTAGARWNIDYKSSSIRIAHNEHMNEIIDNGHTIQVTVDEGSTFTFDGKTYALKQFHFHTPSEHTLNGKHMPMEMHMVHQSADSSLAVIGVLFKEVAKPNENFTKIISHLPGKKGESAHLKSDSINLNVHMPRDNYAYHYVGSLTTPPCSENVQWMVLRDQVGLSADQIEVFSSRIGPNFRPTQPLNDRSIKLDNLKASVTK
ncbi:MAG TPA: carbonic anhydrase family protein, partial [Chitinophagaceae bacterium]|nr:carbonic anhydrase family protein [Chitinophagaceae bacterium]